MYTHVLVSNNGLGNGLGLVGRRPQVLEHLQGFDSAVKIEGHASCSEVFLGSADIVQ
jgi:hypothetical protein